MTALPGPAGPPAVRLSGLSVRFGDRVALHSVDLEVARGTFVALAGPNGSGKTTLLRTLLGFVPSTSGSVELFGRPTATLRPRDRARFTAWVPQEERPSDDVPLLDYVLYGRYAHQAPLEGPSRRDRVRAREILAALDLADRESDGIQSISGGERQRAILARALAQDAPLLLLDEPTVHLDIGHQLDLLERVRRLVRDQGITVLAALHDLNLAAEFAERVVVLSRGRLVVDGPPSEVISEGLLAEVWGVTAELHRDPRTGVPQLIPRRLLSAPAGPPSRLRFGPVHVVAGGGAGGAYLRAFVEQGWRVTAGVLHLLDSDAETAEALGVPAAIEVPFAPIGAEARARHRVLLEGAAAIVVTPFAVGPSNLANLEDLVPYAGRTPTYVVDEPAIRSRDFTGGRAAELVGQLIAAGAHRRDGVTDLLAELGALAARGQPAPLRSGAADPATSAP